MTITNIDRENIYPNLEQHWPHRVVFQHGALSRGPSIDMLVYDRADSSQPLFVVMFPLKAFLDIPNDLAKVYPLGVAWGGITPAEIDEFAKSGQVPIGVTLPETSATDERLPDFPPVVPPSH